MTLYIKLSITKLAKTNIVSIVKGKITENYHTANKF